MNIKKAILSGILACSMLMVLGGCSIIDGISKANIENTEESTENNTTIADDNDNTEIEVNNLEEGILSVGMFIPNGSYEVTYDGSDLLSSENYIKGDGKSYQTIGTDGKGPFIEVYTTKDDGLYRSYSGDLTDEVFNDREEIDYLSERDDVKENILLKGPLTVGTRWDTKEIVEVGENLKLANITLEGTYVKTWEKQKSNEGNEIVQVHYYSEGLGCVEYRILVDGIVAEHSTLKSVTEK